jgi:6-phosphogluconolactonase
MAQLTIADNEVQLAELAAERITQLIVTAIAERGRAFISLAGGSTPRRLYGHLADQNKPWRDRIPWPQLHVFWGDERHVPPDHPDSNFGMAKAALLDHVPIQADHVHRIQGELPDARDAATAYERELDRVASAFSRKNFFDLMLLGLGEDAHIASIFPGSELLDSAERPSTGRRVAAVWASHLKAWRITLTPEAILDARTMLVIAAGQKKAAAVHAALEEPLDVTRHPAQILRTAGNRVEFFLAISERVASTLRSN